MERDVLDRAIAAARARAGKWESMTDLEKREHNVLQWEAIADEIGSAYGEQRAGIANYRLTQEDALYARRVAVWLRYEFSDRAWKADPENAVAFDVWNRSKGRPDAILSDEVKRRLDSRPKAPDTQDPPYLPPTSARIPDNWPHFEGKWSLFVEAFLSGRRKAQEDEAS